MPIILKASPAQKRADLRAYVVGRLASIQAELLMTDDAGIVPRLVAAGYLLPGEGLGDLNYVQCFKGVDWEESIEDNMASVEEDSWRLMKAAGEIGRKQRATNV